MAEVKAGTGAAARFSVILAVIVGTIVNVQSAGEDNRAKQGYEECAAEFDAPHWKAACADTWGWRPTP